MTELEKLDAIRDRLGVSFTKAKEALDANEGNLTAALLYLEARENQAEENKGGDWSKENREHFVRGLIEQIKSIIQEGNVSKVRLKQGEKTIIEIPATLGVVGLGALLFSPLLLALGAIGAATAVIKELTFELERPDGTIESRHLKFKDKDLKEEREDEEI